MHALRETWNDERMDEFAARTEANFAEVRREANAFRVEARDEFKAVRKEIRDQGKELRGEMRQQGTELRGEMNERFASLERRFDILIGAIVSGVVGLILTHLIG